MDKVCCGNCQWSRRVDSDSLFCSFAPPSVVVIRDDADSVLPSVYPTDFCSLGESRNDMSFRPVSHDPDSRILLFKDSLPGRCDANGKWFPPTVSYSLNRMVSACRRLVQILDCKTVEEGKAKQMEDYAETLESLLIDIESDLS